MKWQYANVAETTRLMNDRLEGLVQDGLISGFYVYDARTFRREKLPRSREDLLACLRFRTLQIYNLSAEFSVSDGEGQSAHVVLFDRYTSSLPDVIRLYRDVLKDNNKNGQDYSWILIAGTLVHDTCESSLNNLIRETRYAERHTRLTIPPIRNYEAFLVDVFPGIVRCSLRD